MTKAWAVAIEGAIIVPTIRSTQKLSKEQAELLPILKLQDGLCL